MKNGWYKVEYGKNEFFMKSDYWPPNDEIVYVEDDVITETRNEWGKKYNGPKVPHFSKVDEETKKCMTILEFDGLGTA